MTSIGKKNSKDAIIYLGISLQHNYIHNGSDP